MAKIKNAIPKKRTDEDILLGNGIEVILAGKEYDIKPLPIRKIAEFKGKLKALDSKMFDNIDAKISPQEVMAYFSNMKDGEDISLKIADIILDYNEELKKDKEFLLDNATEIEILNLYRIIVGFSLPLQGAIAGAFNRLK